MDNQDKQQLNLNLPSLKNYIEEVTLQLIDSKHWRQQYETLRAEFILSAVKLYKILLKSEGQLEPALKVVADKNIKMNKLIEELSIREQFDQLLKDLPTTKPKKIFNALKCNNGDIEAARQAVISNVIEKKETNNNSEKVKEPKKDKKEGKDTNETTEKEKVKKLEKQLIKKFFDKKAYCDVQMTLSNQEVIKSMLTKGLIVPLVVYAKILKLSPDLIPQAVENIEASYNLSIECKKALKKQFKKELLAELTQKQADSLKSEGREDIPNKI